MKQSVLHFRIIFTVLSFLLVLSSTGGITSPQTVCAASTEPSAELHGAQETPDSDYLIDTTKESVRQVQPIAAYEQLRQINSDCMEWLFTAIKQ